MSEQIKNSTTSSPPLADNSVDEVNTKVKNDTVYILITQCLQNGFFLADDSRLCLNKEIVAKMLLRPTLNIPDDKTAGDVATQGTPDDYIQVNEENRRYVAQKDVDKLQNGPLYQFLSDLMDDRPENMDTLHAIHIRDWHRPSLDYDVERALYGPHCEADTWESRALDGFETFLSPWSIVPPKDESSIDKVKNRMRSTPEISGKKDTDYVINQQKRLTDVLRKTYKNPHDIRIFQDDLGGYLHPNNSRVIHYPVLSDSVFDFRRADTIIDNVYANELRDNEEVMQQKKERPTNPIHRSPSYLELLINSILNVEQQQATDASAELHVNIVIIGVYTDIKIRTLLTGLRSRYRINNLIVSDVLTASPTLERHLEALDFVHKVLQVEVVHNLNDLINVLAPSTSRVISQKVIEDHVDFRQYRGYYLNKQNLLAYQDTKRVEYLELTRRRSRAIYNQVFNTNRVLMFFGFIFLILSVFISVSYIVSLFIPQLDIPVEHIIAGGLVTGGLSLAQLLTVFIRKPLDSLKANLEQLIQLRSELETHSLILALLRYHFSTPERLHEDYLKGKTFKESQEKYEEEMNRLHAIETQIAMIEKIEFNIHRKSDETEIESERQPVLRQSLTMATSTSPAESDSPTSAG